MCLITRQATQVFYIRAPADLVRELDNAAERDDRTRSAQAVHLLRHALTGKERLAALEAISAAGLERYDAEHARERAPNATAVISEASAEGCQPMLDAHRAIAAGNRRATK
jgi:hypothetical protein